MIEQNDITESGVSELHTHTHTHRHTHTHICLGACLPQGENCLIDVSRQMVREMISFLEESGLFCLNAGTLARAARADTVGDEAFVWMKISLDV